jgi:PTS system nitrogen regulatory IIA component
MLSAGGIHHDVPGTDRSSVLREVVARLPLPAEVDREFVTAVLEAREAMGSTGIGDGIAIPHVRNPIVLHVSRPMVTLCFLENSVDFGALDGQPVRTLFALISPTVRAHLHLLSQLAFALRDPSFKNVVSRQGPREEILEEARRIESALAGASGGGGGEGESRMQRRKRTPA